MLKRSERSSSSSSADRPTQKRNKQKSEEMEGNHETDSLISMEILLDKFIAIESRIEDNFSDLHTQISELACEFKHEINVVKSTLNELEKSVNHAWVKHRGPTARVQSSKRLKKLSPKNDGRTDCGNSKPKS